MSINLSLIVSSDENARSRLQNLCQADNFLKIWKDSESILQDPPTDDPLLRSVATFRDKLLEVEESRNIDISQFKSIIADLQKSPHPSVSQYWREFKIPMGGKVVKLDEVSDAVREFLASSEGSTGDFSVSDGNASDARLEPLLVEIRNDLKAVKQLTENRKLPGSCSDVFSSLNSCFMQ
jgi:hypothetical protein